MAEMKCVCSGRGYNKQLLITIKELRKYNYEISG